MVEMISSDLAPKPNGHYSLGAVVGDTIYVSAQLPLIVGGDFELAKSQNFEGQVQQVLQNILEVVQSAGGTKASIGMVRFYTTSTAFWPRIDKIFAEFMGDHKPARAVLAVTEIKYDFLVMAEAVAEKSV